MKLGCSYNVFDTEELLETSIKSIRNHVDHINVVYQKKSNTGKKCSEELLDTLSDLVAKKLIDKLHLYKPNLWLRPNKNEIRKRNIGLNISKENYCSHFISMDSDEYYHPKELKNAKQYIKEHDIDATACEVINYFKTPNYQMIYPNNVYYVSFISKIRNGIQHHSKVKFPVLVDPTRRIEPGNFHLFKRDDIAMHHMTLVRKNIASKLNNSSANRLYKKNNIDNYVTYFNNWQEGDKVYPPSNYKNFVDIKKVDNHFNINI